MPLLVPVHREHDLGSLDGSWGQAAMRANVDRLRMEFNLGGVIHRLVDQLSAGVFDVRDYGAKGDGVTDDAAAIQSAIDALPTNGGVVFLPYGVYLLNTPLSINSKNVTVEGVGDGSVLLPHWAGNGIEVAQTATTYYTVLRRFRISGDASQGGTALALGNATYTAASLLLDGISLYGFSTGVGLSLGSVQSFAAHDTQIIFNRTNVYGPATGIRTLVEFSGRSSEISGATWWGLKFDGPVQLSIHDISVASNRLGAISATGSANSQVLLRDCHFEGDGADGTEAFLLSGSGTGSASMTVRVSGCAFDEAPDVMFRLNYTSSVFDGNRYLWEGTTPVVTTGNSVTNFLNNSSDAVVTPIATYISALLGSVTAIENDGMYSSRVRASALSTYADEVAAAALATGVFYKTATGELRIKL